MKRTILSQLLFLALFLILLPSAIIKNRQFAVNDPNDQLNQSFTSRQSYHFLLSTPPNCPLNSISLRLKNPLIKNNSPILVDIFADNKLLQSLSFSGSNVGDPDWVQLKINRHQVSSGQYQVTFSTQNTDPNSLFLYTNKQGMPVHQAWCRLGFIDNLRRVCQHRYQQLHQMNQIFLFFYLPLLIGLNYALFRLKK